jgi:hypothetical protein
MMMKSPPAGVLGACQGVFLNRICSVNADKSFADILDAYSIRYVPGGTWGGGSMGSGRIAVRIQGASAVVPIPATLWLFCSGLLGIIGISRQKKVT